MANKKSDNDDVLEALGRFSDIVFARFDQIDSQFTGINSRFDRIESDIQKIYNILDGHLKRIEDILQENSMRDHQQARMEQWIFQIADKIGVQLKYEK